MDRRLEQTIGQLMQTKQCFRCGQLFDDMQEIGSWGCRMHPGMLMSHFDTGPDVDRHCFTCCNVSQVPTHANYRGPDMALGCTRCDHSMQRGVPGLLEIPIERAQILFGDRLTTDRRDGVVFDVPNGVVRIARCQEFTGA